MVSLVKTHTLTTKNPSLEAEEIEIDEIFWSGYRTKILSFGLDTKSQAIVLSGKPGSTAVQTLKAKSQSSNNENHLRKRKPH